LLQTPQILQCGWSKGLGGLCRREKEIVTLGPTSADHFILIQTYTDERAGVQVKLWNP